jgi:hypothetical protein
MPETIMPSFLPAQYTRLTPRRLASRFSLVRLCLAVGLGILAWPLAAGAQGYPPPQGYPPQGNPICQRLEGQLTMIDRGGGDAARNDQMRRYQDAAARQQNELERVTEQARRMGCESSGFFSLFSGQSAQCGPVNAQIQRMRSNLDQITINLDRLRSGGMGDPGRNEQRRSVLVALAQNNCGQQYVNAARASEGGGGFLQDLFGGGGGGETIAPAPADLGPPASTYRTVCVRTCDGYYFPISFATVPSRFGDDERTCKNQCPAADASLFTYRNPGEDINQAVSVSGQPYTALPNAFKYRQEFNPSCSCKAAGQTWAEALKSIDDRSAAENGDIIVTDESSRRMALPPGTRAKTVRQSKGAVPPSSAPAAATPAPVPAPAASTAAPAGDANKPIRSVGPTFIPAR